MPFCENCGAPLEPSAKFCENCGERIDAPGLKTLLGDQAHSPLGQQIGSRSEERRSAVGKENRLTLFRQRDWRERWRRAVSSPSGHEVGIIFTSESRLLQQFPDGNADALSECLHQYIASATTRKVDYYYLNVDWFAGVNYEGSAQENIEILRTIVRTAVPKYLFILGSDTVVDVCCWENQCEDEDTEVWGDLGYAVLDDTSPWEGNQYNFKESLRVGRLPNAADDTFDDFCSYFTNAMIYIGRCNSVRPYGLTTQTWQEESAFEYARISDGEISVSPDVTLDNPDDFSARNLLFFNLHGSPIDAFWYGESLGCIEAVSPEAIQSVCVPHFIGVEACYGAKYVCGLNQADSVLLMAMRNGCLGFLGSSAIAFGEAEPEGSCADLVVGEFIYGVANGETTGDAFAAGLQKIYDSETLDDTDVKTIAEFSLYGDPSARMKSPQQPTGAKSLGNLFGGRSEMRHFQVPMPDVRGAVRLALTEVDAKIQEIVDEFVRNHCLCHMGDVDEGSLKTRTFKVGNSGLYQKMYYTTDRKINSFLKVYFDRNGKIKKTKFSK